ncbi:MAG TPA: hypothetical protein GX733_02705 [Tissierellia bacterium]|nr:hypothetical protein [Tissierellia bacterium]
MKKSTRMITLIFILLFLALALTSCAQKSQPSSVALDETGTIILRVNPEISVEYNKEGLVTKITGENDDGKGIVDTYKDFVGKDARTVVKELVQLIHGAGYFVSEIDGSARNITIEIAAGSVLPQNDYMNLLAEDVLTVVKELNIDTKVMGFSDYDDSNYLDNIDNDSDYAKRSEGSLTLENAKEVALKSVGLNMQDVTFKKVDYDHDDNKPMYKIKFMANGEEFEFKIHVLTGRIHKFERDRKSSDSDYQEAVDPSKLISLDKAKEQVLAFAGLKPADVTFYKAEFDDDDKHPEFELEFRSNGKEFKAEVDAVTGNVMKFERDDKYDDSDYSDDSLYSDSKREPKTVVDDSNYDDQTDYNDSHYDDNTNYDDSHYDDHTNYDDSHYVGTTDYDDSNYDDTDDDSDYQYVAPAPSDSGYDDSGYDDSDYDDSDYD